MSYVYKVKTRDMKKFEDIGWTLAPYEWNQKDNVMVMMKKFDNKSEPVQFLMKTYNNPNWQKEYYEDKELKEVYTEMGMKFRNGKLVRNKAAYKFMHQWCLKVDFNEEEELWLGFSHIDITMPEFYNSAVLDRYCYQEVQQLLEEGLIELHELHDEEESILN